MVRLLVRTAVFLAAAAAGLLVTAAVLPDVSVTATGFLVAVVVYAVVQSLIAPLIAKVAATNATAFIGGVGLVASFVALLAAVLLGDSLRISGGVGTWLAATVVVWFVTAAVTVLLPWALVRAGVEKARLT